MTNPLVGRKRPLSRGAVIAIIAAVVLAAGAGATIASQVAVIACGGGCAPTAVAAGLLGGAMGGVGVAIIGVLVARAFVEWEDIKRRRDGTAAGD
jgi:hypothetical protein